MTLARTPGALLALAILTAVAAAVQPFGKTAHAQSIAHDWNEELLEAIRGDFARPTVHARNLYHLGIVMYDAWAVYEPDAETHFLGKTLGGYTCALEPFPMPADVEAARREAISYAAYRLLRYRFRQSPSRSLTWQRIDSVMLSLGYNPMFLSNAYQNGSAAALGNYLGAQIIAYGNSDGSNDAADYANEYYEPVNPPLVMDEPGNPDIVDPNRWQALALSSFIDQSGNPIPGGEQVFLGPEWGNVVPFALDPAEDAVDYTSGGDTYRVYKDPGPPPYITDPATREAYQRGFEMVAIWSGLLDSDDPTVWDVSPGARGVNVDPLPAEGQYYGYYEEYGGGDTTTGLPINPYTGAPYAPNLVRRGDYGRVLAEFWADGPDSETPPGHWFTILNYVMAQPEFARRWRGQGPELDELEYEVKAYFTLGGAMHDAAIATWSIKGYYDYLRPVSAIRYMAEMGQRTDPNLPRYHEHGLRLEPGFIEFVSDLNDPLAGPNGENIGEIKLFGWLGPTEIADPETDQAGAGWILAKAWWPYQRPTFVSPPFAGYVSGHSTFSRAAAEVLTAMTGTPYFPGGLGTFTAPANEFLVFEEGPSETVQLQWATYRDASDEVSLSRIFGGIHPPADDIPGRRIGSEVAADAFALANARFDTVAPTLEEARLASTLLVTDTASLVNLVVSFDEPMDSTVGPGVAFAAGPLDLAVERGSWVTEFDYVAEVRVGTQQTDRDSVGILVAGARDLYGNRVDSARAGWARFDTRRPTYTVRASDPVIEPADTAGVLRVTLAFDEAMATSEAPIVLLAPGLRTDVLTLAGGAWTSNTEYVLEYDVTYVPDLVYRDLTLSALAYDITGNATEQTASAPFLDVDFLPSGVVTLPGSGLEVRVFPVPMVDRLRVAATGPLSGQLTLRDASGRVVRQRRVAGFGGSLDADLDVRDLPGGSYRLELATDGGEAAGWTVVK